MADILIPVRVDASQLTKIDAMINDLRGKKINIKLDVDDKLLKIDQEINKLQAKKLKLGVDDKEARRKIDEQIKALRQKKAEIRVQARLDQSPLNRDLANLTQQKRELAIKAKMQFDYADYFKRIQGGMSRVGSTMMTAGNTLRRLTTPLESVLRGFAYGAGYQALNKVTEGIKSGFSRYDVMKKYPLMMAQFAKESYSAEQSIKDLDMSVRGLPTGLDQIVDLSQRFTMSLGDMEKGTRLAIATNRAFLASMATEPQQYQGMMQLQDLMNGKKLNSREWMSLGASMGYAINEIGKVLGYKDPGKFRQALYANEIAGEKFLKALEKVGNEGGSVFEKAELAKQTWQAVSANIQNAFSRLGYNVLKALDEVFKTGTDKTFVQWTDELRDGIDKLSESFSGWLKANPDKVLSFFETLRSYDWKGILAGLGEAFMNVARTIRPVMDFLFNAGGGRLGKLLVYGNLLGRFLQLFGGGLKGFSYPVAMVATGVKAITRFTKALVGLAKVKVAGEAVKTAYNVKRLSKSLVGFKVSTKAVQNARNLGRVGTELGSAALSWKGIANKAIGIAAIPAIAGSIWLAANGLKKLSTIDISWGKLLNNINQMNLVMADFGVLAAGVGGLLAATGPVGWLTAGVGAVGLGAIAGLSGTLILMGKAMREISNIEVPDKSHIKNLASNMAEIMPEIKDMIKLFDKDAYNIGGAKSESNKAASVFESISGIIKSLGDISKAEIRPADIKDAVGKIESLETAMGDIDNAIYNLFRKEKKYTNQDPRNQGTKNTVTDLDVQNFAEISKNYSDIFGNIKTTLTNMQKFSKKFENLKKGEMFGGKGKLDLGVLTEPIENIFGQMKALKPTFKKLSELNKEFEKFKLDNLNPFENLTKIFEGIESFRNKFVEMKEGKGFGGKGKLDLSVITDEIEALVPLFEGKDGKSGVNAIMEKLGEVSDHFGDVDTEAVQKAFDGLTNIFTAIEGFRNQYAPMVKGEGFGGKGKLSFDDMRGRIESITDFLTSLTESGKEGEESLTTALQEIGTTFGMLDLSPVKKAFANLKNIVTEMNNLQTTATETGFIGKGSPLTGLTDFVGSLGTALNEMGDKLVGLETKFSESQVESLVQVKRAFAKIKEIANTLGQEGIAKPVEQIKKAINEIKNIDWSGMDIPPIDIKVQIKLTAIQPIDTTAVTLAVGSAIGDVSKAVSEIPVDIEKKIPVKLVAGDITGKDAVVSAVESAIDSIQRRVNNLQSSITKTVTVRVVRSTVTEGAIGGGGGRAVPWSTGGYIGGKSLYRASGGSIFKPKGTDTVPAMLTPGEYVNKRAVVNKLGIPFFQRLNNLDIPGALRELSIRTGMKLGSGTTINNYNTTTNNLTNNISVPMSESESRGFTMRKMGRFAGAL